MNATYRLVKDTLANVPSCPDGPTGACISCLASAVTEALEIGAAMERHPAGKDRHDGTLDLVQALCSHIWPGELGTEAQCQLCQLWYSEFLELEGLQR